jgi:hypothetical protein
MIDLPVLAIDECELLPTGVDAALLRVGGRWENAAPGGIQLYVPSDGAGSLVDALPPGVLVSGDGDWSAAFSVDPAAVGERLALVPAVGRAVAFAIDDAVPAEPKAREVERPAGSDTELRLERALEDLADAEALVSQLRRRCELSERGVSDFRDKLVQAWGEAAEMREMLDSREAAHATVKERAGSALAVVSRLEARARRSEDELAARRQEMEEQCALLDAELERRAGAEAGAREVSDEMRAQAADALERFEAARSDADVFSERLAKAERELAEAQQQLAEAGAERDAAPAQATVEADLRHLLAICQGELDEARAALNEQQARYAAVAGDVVTELVVPLPDAVIRTGDQPWTAVDEELLSRIARAKEFAGGD